MQSTDLTGEQLRQEITLTLPLGVVLGLNAPQPQVVARLAEVKKEGTAIGERGLYGIYAGIARGYGGEPDGIIEVLAEAPSAMSWQDALAWAESVGGRLPTRHEQALLYANVPELFQEAAYWSGEQHASDAASAWCTRFSHGTQGDWPKANQLRARAVRRVPILKGKL